MGEKGKKTHKTHSDISVMMKYAKLSFLVNFCLKKKKGLEKKGLMKKIVFLYSIFPAHTLF